MPDSAAASEAPISTTARLEKTTAVLPLVRGSVAFYLGKAADEFSTHVWTLYLRGANNEDLSVCIQKVTFQLHASFQQPLREFTEPPFEVTEKGWGEFEAQIRIYWKDPTEKTTMVAHMIKLYPPGTPANTLPTNTEEPVVDESYDEVVFTDPTEAFFKTLQAVREAPTIEQLYSQHQHFQQFSDTEDVHALLEAQKFLREQLRTARERLKAVQDGSAQLEDEVVQHIEKQQQQQQQQQQQRRGNTSSLPVAAAGAKADSKAAANRSRPAPGGGGGGGAKKKTAGNKKLKTQPPAQQPPPAPQPK